MQLILLVSRDVSLGLKNHDVSARLVGVCFGWLQREIVIQCRNGIVEIAFQFERAREVVVGIAPPRSEIDSPQQQAYRLIESACRGGVLDLA